MPTNAEIWREIVELKMRMDGYEQKAKESHAVLLNVQTSVNGYKQSFIKIGRFLKWLGAVCTGVLITYIASIAIHYLHP